MIKFCPYVDRLQPFFCGTSSGKGPKVIVSSLAVLKFSQIKQLCRKPLPALGREKQDKVKDILIVNLL